MPGELEHLSELLDRRLMLLKETEDVADLLIHKEFLFVTTPLLTQLLGFPIVFEGFFKVSELHESVASDALREVAELKIYGAMLLRSRKRLYLLMKLLP